MYKCPYSFSPEVILPHSRHDYTAEILTFQDQKIPMRGPQVSAVGFGFTRTWYGNGFWSVVVMGGMWSLYWFTMLTILKAAFWSDLVIARRTFMTSVQRRGLVFPHFKWDDNDMSNDSMKGSGNEE